MTDEEGLTLIREAIEAGVIHKVKFGGEVLSNPMDILERYKAGGCVQGHYSDLPQVVMSRVWPNIGMTERVDVEEFLDVKKKRGR